MSIIQFSFSVRDFDYYFFSFIAEYYCKIICMKKYNIKIWNDILKIKRKLLKNYLPSSQKQIKGPSYSGWYSKDTNSSRYNSFYFCLCEALSFRKAESALIATVKSNILNGMGVTRHLSHETRRDTRLSSRERDEIFFRLFFLEAQNHFHRLFH